MIPHRNMGQRTVALGARCESTPRRVPAVLRPHLLARAHARRLSGCPRHKAVLAERYGVAELALFGSFVRDEARADIDIDIS